MKKTLVVLTLVAAVFAWQHVVKQAQLTKANSPPEPISHPVYAEIHIERNSANRSIELVMLAKTIDQTDCEKAVKEIPAGLRRTCADCGLKSFECKREIAPHYLKLFDNKPTHVSYISFQAGAAAERDMRFLAWGVSLEESHKICDLIPKFQQSVKGPVSCIRALN